MVVCRGYIAKPYGVSDLQVRRLILELEQFDMEDEMTYAFTVSQLVSRSPRHSTAQDF